MATLEPHHVFDGHNDAITRWTSRGRPGAWTFLGEAGSGHLDMPRARAGGFVGGFFAICPWVETGWSPRGANYHVTDDGFHVDLAPAIEHEPAHAYCVEMFERLLRTERDSGGAFRLARTAADLDVLDPETMLAVAHFEGAEAIDVDLERLAEWHALGLRSIGPVWSRPNVFGTGVPFAFPASPDIGPGLTDAGKRLVGACDELGIVIDLSHMNEKGFWDVAALTARPLVVTHTAAHALCPKPRNLTDAQIDAVAESGGVVGVTFFVNDLRASKNPGASAPLSEIVRHVAYLVDRAGVQHVALGSDFDGASIPADLVDAAGLPKLVEALRQAGLDGDELACITHRNWLRILANTLS